MYGGAKDEDGEFAGDIGLWLERWLFGGLVRGARSVHNQVDLRAFPSDIFSHLPSFNISSLSMVMMSTDEFLTVTSMHFAEVRAFAVGL